MRPCHIRRMRKQVGNDRIQLFSPLLGGGLRGSLPCQASTSHNMLWQLSSLRHLVLRRIHATCFPAEFLIQMPITDDTYRYFVVGV